MSDTSSKQSEPGNINRQLNTLRVLLFDALEAGGYLPIIASWSKHHNGEILYFREKSLDIERTGKLVLVDTISDAIIRDSISIEHPIYVVVGGRLGDNVDLGKWRAQRVADIQSVDRHYWATFVLEGSILVTLGMPPSPCRLIGEVLNLQTPTPFIQSRICPSCHSINSYHSVRCAKCSQPLHATGRLG